MDKSEAVSALLAEIGTSCRSILKAKGHSAAWLAKAATSGRNSARSSAEDDVHLITVRLVQSLLYLND
jgi:hypothetical protein